MRGQLSCWRSVLSECGKFSVMREARGVGPDAFQRAGLQYKADFCEDGHGNFQAYTNPAGVHQCRFRGM